MCVLISYTNLSETFFILRRNERRMIIIVYRSSWKAPVVIGGFNEATRFWTDFQKIIQITWKSVQWEPSCYMVTDRQTDWLTDRMTDRQTDWLTDRMTDRQTDWQTDWLTDRQTNWQTDKLTDRPTDRLTDWQTDWQTDRLTDWQTDRQTYDESNSRIPQFCESAYERQFQKDVPCYSHTAS